MKSSHMALISVENMTVGLVCFQSIPAFFSRICMTAVSDTESAHPGQLSQLRISDLSRSSRWQQSQDVSSQHNFRCLSARPRQEKHSTLCCNICAEMEFGWKRIPPLWCRFLRWELACFTKWLTAQPCNKQGCLSQLRSVQFSVSLSAVSAVVSFQCRIWLLTNHSGYNIDVLLVDTFVFKRLHSLSTFVLIIQVWPLCQQGGMATWIHFSFSAVSLSSFV